VALAACGGKPDATACVLPTAGAAECLRGVCTGVICGDGLVVGDEVCDDGNTIRCDGCSADCRSTEGCGNSIVECNEECDQGSANSLAPNVDCRPDCRRQRCGDGIFDNLSGEDCDGAPPVNWSCQTLGFYEGSVACSPACRVDTVACTGFCGDGVINGPELCDGTPPPGESCLDYAYDIGNLYCNSLCTPNFAACERMGFSPMSFDGNAYLYSVWGTSTEDLFAVGYGGGIMHYDGTTWTAMASPTTDALYGVWGAASNDVWAVGRGGLVLHYDGSTWTAVNVDTDIELYVAWGSGPSDVFVCGQDGAMLHFDGSTWTSMSTGLGEGTALMWVNGSGPNDVYACSDMGNVLHYDGATWTDISNELPVDPASEWYYYAIWSSGPENVWVVGDGGMVLHFDGTAWTQVDVGRS